MYYNIKESGKRIQDLRTARQITRQDMADQIGISIDALRKIEKGTNGAKIDTLVVIATLFHTSLDYLICGESSSQKEIELEVSMLLTGLDMREKKFLKTMIETTIKAFPLLREN